MVMEDGKVIEIDLANGATQVCFDLSTGTKRVVITDLISMAQSNLIAFPAVTGSGHDQLHPYL